jgi:hypothetical protein
MKNHNFPENQGRFAPVAEYQTRRLALFGTVLMLLLCASAPAQTPKFTWARQNAGDGTACQAFSVVTDSAGNAYVSGSYNCFEFFIGAPPLIVTDPPETVFLSKYDRSGNVLWTRTTGAASPALGSACAVDTQGNIFVAGSFGSTNLSFGTVVLTNSGLINMFLAKFNPDGNLLWARQAGGSDGADGAFGMVVDEGGNAYITGQLGSTNAMFGNFPLANSQATSNSTDSFVAKYDGAGNALWARRITQTLGVRPSFSPGAIYVLGLVTNVADFGGGVWLTNSSSDGTFHTFLAKYDLAGNPLWSRQVATGNPNTNINLPLADFPTGIAANSNGNIFITGCFLGTNAIFDAITLTNHGDFDSFIARYDQAGGLVWVRGVGGKYDDFATCITADAAGNCYAAGFFDSATLDFGGIIVTNSTSSEPTFIAKYDSAGNILWAKHSVDLNYNLSWAYAASIVSDPWGNLRVVGSFNSTAAVFDDITLSNSGPSEIFVAKIAGPQVGIHPLGNQVTLCWPTNAAGLHLENAASLSAGNWSPVTNAPVVLGDQNTLTLEPSSSGSQFYRLQTP